MESITTEATPQGDRSTLYAENEVLFHFGDSLTQLTEDISLVEKVRNLHTVIARRYLAINRIATALYDPHTDDLRMFVYSGESTALRFYTAKLNDMPSLQEIVDIGKPRVVNDTTIFNSSHKKHQIVLSDADNAASYTLPMVSRGVLYGFIFFNSSDKGFFTEETLVDLDMAGHLLAMTVIHELTGLRTLQAAINTARDITRHRDAETGSHLERMAHYTRLIAQGLAEKYQLTDEYIEHLCLIAPLHDIGKIAIPDGILLKPGKLTEEEIAIMRTHTTHGAEIIDTMLEHFRMDGSEYIQVMRNITLYHHEMLDGTGYPAGITSEDIPLEAKIVSVADVFDALTSNRPYKQAWANQRAYEELSRMAGSKLDADCVEALLENKATIEEIQRTFQEDSAG